MSKEKLLKLNKYEEIIKSKLSDRTVPEKQKNRVFQYKLFLEKELSQTTAKIENLKILLPTDSKK